MLVGASNGLGAPSGITTLGCDAAGVGTASGAGTADFPGKDGAVVAAGLAGSTGTDVTEDGAAVTFAAGATVGEGGTGTVGSTEADVVTGDGTEVALAAGTFTADSSVAGLKFGVCPPPVKRPVFAALHPNVAIPIARNASLA